MRMKMYNDDNKHKKIGCLQSKEEKKRGE